MKDPAVLFYFQDFLVGTEFMSHDEVGKYIRILCHQADNGSLTLLQLQRICGSKEVPDAILEKLQQDEEGKFYQKRMKEEKEKRTKYSESRRQNRKKDTKEENICLTYDKHMENENINVNESIIEDSKELFNELKKTFLEFYKLKTENEYYFTAKDASNLKQLGKKLIHSIRNKGDTPAVQDAVNALSYIMQHHNDKWIDANFSIPILNSKYNEIISGIKQRHVKGTSDQQLAEILAKHING